MVVVWWAHTAQSVRIHLTITEGKVAQVWHWRHCTFHIEHIVVLLSLVLFCFSFSTDLIGASRRYYLIDGQDPVISCNKRIFGILRYECIDSLWKGIRCHTKLPLPCILAVFITLTTINTVECIQYQPVHRNSHGIVCRITNNNVCMFDIQIGDVSSGIFWIRG